MSTPAKSKRPSKASTKQRIACFMAALPDLNPNWDKPKPEPKNHK